MRDLKGLIVGIANEYSIALYRKAACDATLKPIIEGRLWHIRTTSDNPVVVDELNKYHLMPNGPRIMVCLARASRPPKVATHSFLLTF